MNIFTPEKKVNSTSFKTMNGFTLIETFVAILVLVMAMLGPMMIASQGIMLSKFSREQVTANFLAQDAIEYVRWIRDTNQLTSTTATPVDWMLSLTPCVSTTGATKCYFDTSYADPWITNKPMVCPGGSTPACPVLNYNPSSGLYNYSAAVVVTNPATVFTRIISIQKPIGTNNNCVAPNACEAYVKAVITWTTGTVAHTVTVGENIMPWAGSF